MGIFSKRSEGAEGSPEENKELEQESSVEEEPKEPQFGLRENLSRKMASMDINQLDKYLSELKDMSPEDAVKYASGVLKGKGALGGSDKQVKKRLLEVTKGYKGELKESHKAQLDEIKSTSLLLRKIKEEGYESAEEWVVNMSPEEVMKAQYAYLGGKGSRSTEDVKQIREFLLEAAEKAAEQAHNDKSPFLKVTGKLAKVKVFGKPLSTTFFAGAVAGGAARKGIRLAFMGTAGFIPFALAGAGGGAVAASARSYFTERRAYKNLLKEMSGGKARLDNVSTEQIYERLEKWDGEKEKAKHPRTIERLMDERRYLLMALKKKMKKEDSPEAFVNGILSTEHTDTVNGTGVEEIDPLNEEARELFESIKSAKLVDRARWASAVRRGALIGAIGGVVGGMVMDHFSGDDGLTERAFAKGEDIIDKNAPIIEGSGIPEELFSPEAPTGVSTEELFSPEAPITPEELIAPTYSPLPGEVFSEEIPADQNASEYLHNQLDEMLGREATPLEYQAAAEEFMSDNNIALSDMYGPIGQSEIFSDGTMVDLSGVNEAAHSIVAGIPIEEATDSFILSMESLPNETILVSGSNPWIESHDWIGDILGRHPTNAEIMAIDKIICEDSNVGVPMWGIEGDVDHRKIPIGYKLDFTRAKGLLVDMLNKESGS